MADCCGERPRQEVFRIIPDSLKRGIFASCSQAGPLQMKQFKLARLTMISRLLAGARDDHNGHA